MSKFIQLNEDDIFYLNELIEDDVAFYCARQREWTRSKLVRILTSPREHKLSYLDVTYLLELIEDDGLEDCDQQRELTLHTLMEIRQLQLDALRNTEDKESAAMQERHIRRAKRSEDKRQGITV